ncbi:MAG: mechanosensitive ion channel family protein [Hominenteromicrobium sp.]
MTQFWTVLTAATNPLEDVPTASELQKWLEKIGEQAFYLLIRILIALVLLFIGTKLIRFMLKKFKKSKLFQRMDPGLASFTMSASKVVLYILLVLVLMGVLGIETTSFLALFTSGGVAVALAFQGAVSNLAGGVMILLFHPFRVGDYIETTEIAGTVKEINVLYTVVITPDNKRVTVPNGSLTNTAITDYSAETRRRVDIVFSAAYASDIDTVKSVILAEAAAHEKVLHDPAPEARLKAQSASALDFQLRAWCAPSDYWDVFFDLNENVKKAFDRNHIEIPFPQVDVHMR